MPSTKKQIQLLLTAVDEEVFSQALLEQLHDLRFLDGNVWPTSPEEASRIDTCKQRLCYLYMGRIEDLPSIRRPDGKLQGPASGCVVQISRPMESEGVLYSGSMGVGFDSSSIEMKEFVSDVWQSLGQIGTRGVLRPDGSVDNNYFVGQDAGKRALAADLSLRDRSVEIYYDVVVRPHKSSCVPPKSPYA